MHRCLTVLALLMIAGCESQHTLARDDMFAPASVRIHPTFTQIKDWTADGRPDGIEAVVELLDGFEEPTRGSGRLLFELFDYKPEEPDPAGSRLAGPWVEPLETRQQQDAHWSAALRAYTFQLSYPTIGTSHTYVLTVSFETTGGATRPGGGRLFSRLIIEPPSESRKPERRVRRSGGAKR